MSGGVRMLSGFKRLFGAAALCWLAAWAAPTAAGVAPGLQGEYFNNMTLSGVPVLTRIDPTVNFNWGSGSPGAGVNANQFSVRWSGQVRIPANGTYTFYTQSDDGVRLWVDCNGNGSFQPGEQLVNNWTDHSSTENSGSCAGLSAGGWVILRMEFYENGGDAVAQLSWSGPGIAKQIIPAYDGTRGLGYDDTTPPTIVSATTSCGLADRVAAVFSEAVDPATATAIGNYSLNRGASVIGATLAPDGRTVLLQTSTLSSTGNYQLTVNNVRDLTVPPNSIAANTRVNFSYPGGGLRNGLSATYYAQGGVSGAFFTGSTVSRIDSVVDFDWGGGSPAVGIGADNFSVRWMGYVQAPVSGVYTFRTQSDDGIRLWVGGSQVINNWTDHGPTYDAGAVTLAAGQYYAVTLEFYERGGGAVARLQWQKPGDAAFSTLPAGNLFHCDSTPPDIEAVQTTCGVNNRINVVFTEPVDPATATVAGNYQLNNGASVSSAAMAGDGRTVSLLTSVLATGLTYQLRVRNVLDTAVPPNEVANPTTDNFTLAAGSLLSGLTGTYYAQGGVSGAFFTGSTVSRIDSVVDFDWGGGSPAVGIGADNFSVRWMGYVQAPVSGVYTFRTQSDDGIRLWVGGSQVINNWTDHGPTYDAGAVTLAAGQYYAVTLEFYERGGGAVARLQWQKPGDAAFSTLPAGNLFHCGTAAVAPGGFNAFETSTPAGNIAGVITTKVAAQAFDLAVVTLNLAKTGVETAFEGDVRIELLDASAGGVIDTNGCSASWTPLPAFVPPTLAFTAADLGRKNITLTENNVWRDVRVRMSYPATGAPTVIGCSTDNFAIRPAALGFAATDLDWQTAGTARTLNNAVFPGGAVHKAGQPFTLSVTGYNATSAVATNYNGSPAASLVGFVLPALGACPTCLLNAGTFAGTGGTVVSSTATYSEAGVIQMQAYDDTFSAVDAGDGSSVPERTAYSTISTVGRFVPDHFTLTAGAVSAACTVGAPPFTYMNQSFQSLSATVQAQNAAGNLTVNYDSAGFAPGNLATVAWQAENADNGIDLSVRLNVPSPSPTWAGGAFSVSTAAAGFRRATPDNPDGPFDNLQLGVRLTDPDGVTLNGMDMNAASAGACAPCNAKAVGGTASVRFGRLRLGNAHGSELRQLRMPASAEYWNGIGFVGNVVDNCTGVGATTLNAAPSTCTLTPPVTGVGSTLSSGSATLTLGPPNVRGCTDIRLATPAWLQGNWDGTDQLGDGNRYDDDASARASFGTFRDRMIFRREVTR